MCIFQNGIIMVTVFCHVSAFGHSRTCSLWETLNGQLTAARKPSSSTIWNKWTFPGTAVYLRRDGKVIIWTDEAALYGIRSLIYLSQYWLPDCTGWQWISLVSEGYFFPSCIWRGQGLCLELSTYQAWALSLSQVQHHIWPWAHNPHPCNFPGGNMIFFGKFGEHHDS